MRGRKLIKNEATDAWYALWSLDYKGWPSYLLFDEPKIAEAASKIVDSARKEYVKRSKDKGLPDVHYMLQAYDDGIYVEWEIK